MAGRSVHKKTRKMFNREKPFHGAGRSSAEWGGNDMSATMHERERASVRSAESDAPNLTKILDVLLACLREETEAIGRSLAFDLKSSNAMKSRLLYELSRACRGTYTGSLQTGSTQKLLLLKAELSRNAQIVGAHLSAVREIAGLMIDAARREEADGTYCRPSPNRAHA
jgi:hypothetical protein